MARLKHLLIESLENTVYHVTFTKNVPKIRNQDLRLMRTSNWEQAATKERYGSGEIYVFENFKDAYKWALKMDWEFNSKFGSGKISILNIRDTGEWEVDDASPLEQIGAEGKWLKKFRAIPPEDIIEYVIVDKNLMDKVKNN